jgi:glycosidase
MAPKTPLSYRNLVLYEVYVRNHGPNGTFADVEADLERLRDMGVDVVWFMPIHPIGKKDRKGSLGSPYAIANYREVNPEYGTKEDFSRLIQKAHQLGLRVMIDVVYNHTAPDSNLVQEHPDWYHQNAEGIPVTSVPAWSDIIDLKFPDPDLEEYLIETLVGWAKFGVDGFRCDVASIVPVDFWLRARERVEQVKPGVIWLAESVHAAFVGGRRAASLRAHSDSEVFRAFDLGYDYDIWPIWQAAVTGQAPVARYLEMLRFQECIYPDNGIKMRCVENHDQARILNLAPTRSQALAWTAFQAFNKGAFLIYGGQEAAMVHTPSLFEDDKVVWGTYELQPFLTALAAIKKENVLAYGVFTICADEPAVVVAWEGSSDLAGENTCLLGIFNVSGMAGMVNVPVSDGDYQDILSGNSVSVRFGQAQVPETAIVLRYHMPVQPRWFYSLLLDLHIPSDSQG